MLEPLNESFTSSLETDVCIAGAGPAGIVLALALERAGLSTVLLEAGLLDEPGPNGRDAYSGEVTGLAYPLRASRLRWFGGTTNHWGGWCMPLNEIDYSRRPGSPLPSWPIGPADVAPFVEAASTWCELSSSQFDAYQGITNPAEQLLFAGDEMFTDQLFRFSPPTNFGKSYRQEVADSTTIRCVYNATLVSMEHEVGIVRDALAASPEGDTVKIIAQRFVLAMGGIENPRFLLHLADTTGANFGQASGLVGACFMDHFGFAPGYLEASSGLRYDRHQVRGAPVMPVITVRPEVQQNLNLPSIRIEATPVGFSPELPHAFFHNPGILGALRNNAARYSLIMNVEPTAHADSRITLGNERDAFGIRRIRLCWQVLEQDYLDTERFLALFEQALGRQGMGRLQRTRRFEGEYRERLTGGMHHMGTTRMSDTEQCGVVDPDCRVYGSENLYVAGSSVFPRVGYANPTLTIVALAERLARHLASEA